MFAESLKRLLITYNYQQQNSLQFIVFIVAIGFIYLCIMQQVQCIKIISIAICICLNITFFLKIDTFYSVNSGNIINFNFNMKHYLYRFNLRRFSLITGDEDINYVIKKYFIGELSFLLIYIYWFLFNLNIFSNKNKIICKHRIILL